MDLRCQALELSSLPDACSRSSESSSRSSKGSTESLPAADAALLSLDTMQHMAVCPALHALDWQVQAELKEPPDQGKVVEVQAFVQLGRVQVSSSPEQTAFMQHLLKARKQQPGLVPTKAEDGHQVRLVLLCVPV